MSYTVTESHGCKVLEGQVPLLELAYLLRAWEEAAGEPEDPEDAWVVDAKLSDWLGVTLVCGGRRATTAWRDELWQQMEGK
jgi:hypothetical protein